uniref:Uncharacterized protein n=1 Tax=Acrobeloides nanus TaxID=290746 RepID=A0A914DHM0_9BILA
VGKAGPTGLAYKCYMETSFTIQDDGILNATTKTYSNLMRIFGNGFTGGVFMTLMDTEKKNIWSSELHAFNVKAGDSRTDRWNETIPLKIFPSIKYYGIVHKHVPANHVKWFAKNQNKLFAETKENAELIMVAKN